MWPWAFGFRHPFMGGPGAKVACTPPRKHYSSRRRTGERRVPGLSIFGFTARLGLRGMLESAAKGTVAVLRDAPSESGFLRAGESQSNRYPPLVHATVPQRNRVCHVPSNSKPSPEVRHSTKDAVRVEHLSEVCESCGVVPVHAAQAVGMFLLAGGIVNICATT